MEAHHASSIEELGLVLYVHRCRLVHEARIDHRRVCPLVYFREDLEGVLKKAKSKLDVGEAVSDV